MKKIKIIISSISILLLVLSAIIFSGTLYIGNKFDQDIDEVIFYLVSGIDGAASDVFITGIFASLAPFLILVSLLIIPIIRTQTQSSIEVSLRSRKIEFKVFPINLLYKFRLLYALTILFVSIFTSYQVLGIKDYIERLTNYSTLIEDYNVSGNDTILTFPEKKRNLIILYVESLENSMISKENGGGWEYTVIPELEKIAMENINFSDSEKIGGFLPIYGTGWTVGGLVGTTTGLPLKVPVNGNEYTSSENFLAGAYALGDALKEQGYNLQFMCGSDANFGGRKNFYVKHGNHKIFDLNTAIEEGKMKESEKVWWGFDDTNLFEWAKEEINSLASSEKPFSFTFLTANTHFPDGYVESGMEHKFDTQYENVYAHTSKQVVEFVHWFEQQDYYEDTTLVILGDHFSMQPNGYFTEHTYEGYNRTVYNAFINSSIKPTNSNNRIITSLDMYPTILASIGVEIEGDRLGLGTNLFSERKTLVEELGYLYVYDELSKNSHFYNEHILQGDYLDLLKKVKKE